MIKNLKNKFLICLFLLVTVFSVTSSCFAISNVTFADIDECIISLDKVNQCLTEKGYTDVIGSKYVALKVDNGSSYSIYYYFFPDSIDTYFLEHKTTSNTVNMYNSSGTLIKPTCITLLFMSFDIKGADSVSNYYFYDDAFVNFKFNGTNGNILYHSDFTIKNSDGSVFYEPKISYVNVTHEFQSDTSAKVNFAVNNAPDGAILKYSLSGVEFNMDLNAPLQLKNPITYTPRSNKFIC